MKISNLVRGLIVLSARTEECSIEVVPKSFPGGAPDHSNSAYVAVEAYVDPLGDIGRHLIDLDWTPESDGEVWCFRNF